MWCMVGDDAAGDRQAQLLRGALDMCLLALLDARPAHGYELVQRVGDAGLPSIGYGTIYPLLTRMRRLGLVAQEVQNGPHGPARKVYALTDAGRSRLRSWSGQWHEFVSVVDHILTQPVPTDARS